MHYLWTLCFKYFFALPVPAMAMDLFDALKVFAVLILIAGLWMGWQGLSACSDPDVPGVQSFSLECFLAYSSQAIMLCFAGLLVMAFALKKPAGKKEKEKPAVLHFYKP